jgi:hypothetical protein
MLIRALCQVKVRVYRGIDLYDWPARDRSCFLKSFPCFDSGQMGSAISGFGLLLMASQQEAGLAF